MPITLTQSAAARVRDHLQSHHDSEGLRLSVKTSGCSGLAYELDYAKKTAGADEVSDEVFESHGVKIFVEPKHLEFLQGTEIDYVQEGLSAAFHFKNPNVTEECGCGESFTVK